MRPLLAALLLGNCECVAPGELAICDCKAVAHSPFDRLISSKDSQPILNLLRLHGFEAGLEKDEIGDPLIRVAARGQMDGNHASNPFQIRFWHCDHGQRCNKLFFQAVIDVDPVPSQDQINDWDFNEPDGLAYLLHGKPALEMPIATNQGAMSPTEFIAALDRWLIALNRFERHIGAPQD